MTTMQRNIRDVIQDIRGQLDRADVQPSAEARVGMTMFAVSQLLDLVERLYEHIVDLERVQNERATE